MLAFEKLAGLKQEVPKEFKKNFNEVFALLVDLVVLENSKPTNFGEKILWVLHIAIKNIGALELNLQNSVFEDNIESAMRSVETANKLSRKLTPANKPSQGSYRFFRPEIQRQSQTQDPGKIPPLPTLSSALCSVSSRSKPYTVPAKDAHKRVGRLNLLLNNWLAITNDSDVLSHMYVWGYKLEFLPFLYKPMFLVKSSEDGSGN